MRWQNRRFCPVGPAPAEPTVSEMGRALFSIERRGHGTSTLTGWRSSRVPFAGGEGVCPMAKASNRVTSKAVAQKASKALSDGRSSDRTKSIAASALSQRKR